MKSISARGNIFHLEIGELEERQRAAVSQGEEGVAVRAFSAEEDIRFGPGGDQGHADDVLVETSGGFLIVGHKGDGEGGRVRPDLEDSLISGGRS